VKPFIVKITFEFLSVFEVDGCNKAFRCHAAIFTRQGILVYKKKAGMRYPAVEIRRPLNGDRFSENW